MWSLEQIKAIKKLVVEAIFSDDTLMEQLVLKGGNAIDLVYGLSERASMDLDFSIPGRFEVGQMAEIETRLKKTLDKTFKREGFVIFDFNFSEKPRQMPPDLEDFWGGYKVEFKFITEEKYRRSTKDTQVLVQDPQTLVRQAERIFGAQTSPIIKIDISKYEFCEPKVPHDFEDYTIYVYTPAMLVFEKLRALCQQTDAYQKVIGTDITKARARDFYDIYILMQTQGIDTQSEANQKLLKRIFDCKKARLSVDELLKKKEIHAQDFESVRATLRPDAAQNLKDFDFYFSFVIETFGFLETLWNEETPSI